MRNLHPPSHYTVEEEPKAFLFQYSEELACAVLEQATKFARHRGSGTIELVDINIALQKRFGIDLPQNPLPHPLHKSTIAPYVSQSSVVSVLKRSAPSNDGQEGEENVSKRRKV